MTPISIAVGLAFAVIGAASERLASVWPPDEAQRRPTGWRTVLLAAASALAAVLVVLRSELPAWATGGYLVLLALLVVLTATDLEQRRLPHLVLDPLIVLAAAFVPFNPAVEPAMAIIGAVAAVAFLGALALVVRGGLALGDLYLVAPIGLMLGWPVIFTALFAAAFLAAGSSLALLATRRVGMRSYIPFGPFLVGGAVLALLLDDRVLTVVR
ncbi:MAG TPA: A24 family peptidase [Candidatus Limnocylindria bacterium]|nr:A24 family peptidase [Candidatus Limnocylindria bacterium]HEX4815101.1 A24 family peptidase [Nonomuraea sp.]